LIRVNVRAAAGRDDNRMWPYHADLLGAPVPRYTSYPTAADFGTGVGGEDQSHALAAVAPDQPLSLYVHIPYCKEICWYCGCNTGAANKELRLAGYLEALEREIALVGAGLGGRGVVRHIAFGGGSPNAIAPVAFIRLLQQIILCMPADRPEIAVEIDPRTLSDDWVEALGAVGTSRVSLGVQTFSPQVQAAIGRVQPAGMIARAVERLRAAGIGSINFDLMYGLPGQWLADRSATLDRAIAMRPDRIACFGYAHVPHLIPRQRRIVGHMPGQAERFAMARVAFDTLARAGYVPVGFDHFALPDDSLAVAHRAGGVRRNFQGFTADGAETVIGIGASAISSFGDLIIQNEKNPGRYRMRLSADQLPGALGVRRSAQDRQRGQVIADILCRGQADAGGLLDDPLITVALQPFYRRGLLVRGEERLFLTDGALPYARSIAAAFDAYRVPTSRRFSSAV